MNTKELKLYKEKESDKQILEEKRERGGGWWERQREIGKERKRLY